MMKKLFLCVSLVQGSFIFAMKIDIKEYVEDYKTLMSIIHKIADVAERIPKDQYELEMRENVKFDFTGYQTREGFMLGLKHGAPDSIYWRLGRARFAKGFVVHMLNGEKRFLDTLNQHFDIKEDQAYREYTDLHDSRCQDVISKPSGILHVIHNHTHPLPQAVFRSCDECIPEEQARRIYKEILRH